MKVKCKYYAHTLCLLFGDKCKVQYLVKKPKKCSRIKYVREKRITPATYFFRKIKEENKVEENIFG